MNTLINILNGEDDLLCDRCESTSRERWTRLLTHIICIGLIFILPEILAATGRPFREVPQLRWGSYMKAAVYIAVFYVNYFVIMEHAYRRRAPTIGYVKSKKGKAKKEKQKSRKTEKQQATNNNKSNKINKRQQTAKSIDFEEERLQDAAHCQVGDEGQPQAVVVHNRHKQII